jgi:N-acetylglutamate synthase-like GNAT family acetyltransferase
MTGLAYSIRKAEQRDIELLALIELAAGSIFPEGRVDPTHTYPTDLLNACLQQGLLFVACVESLVAGFAVHSIRDGSLHLEELAVHPRYGRQGIGRGLVLHTQALAESLSLDSVTLTTFADLKWNAPFYASLGFKTLAEDDLPEHLSDILIEEAQQGMIRRVAMRASAVSG